MVDNLVLHRAALLLQRPYSKCRLVRFQFLFRFDWRLGYSLMDRSRCDGCGSYRDCRHLRNEIICSRGSSLVRCLYFTTCLRSCNADHLFSTQRPTYTSLPGWTTLDNFPLQLRHADCLCPRSCEWTCCGGWC